MPTTSRDATGRIGKVAGDVAGTPIDLVKDVQTDAAGNVTQLRNLGFV
ncbi:hypothetical protein [Thauera sinica]|uniref:Uncharacterized protein n=1 Tax=Thauera sinica TaxID=2665146 RepID=A0ABW1APL6_9RHOO|nr:hypothetical protein [Thauera sp. K11]